MAGWWWLDLTKNNATTSAQPTGFSHRSAYGNFRLPFQSNMSMTNHIWSTIKEMIDKVHLIHTGYKFQHSYALSFW